MEASAKHTESYQEPFLAHVQPAREEKALMDDKEVKRRLRSNEDFVALKRFNYSIREVEERYPDGTPDHLIAQALGLTEAEVLDRYNAIVLWLRQEMKVEGVEDDREEE